MGPFLTHRASPLTLGNYLKSRESCKADPCPAKTAHHNPAVKLLSVCQMNKRTTSCGSTQLARVSLVHPPGLCHDWSLILIKMFTGDLLRFFPSHSGLLRIPVCRWFRQGYVSVVHKGDMWSHGLPQSVKRTLMLQSPVISRAWTRSCPAAQCQPHLTLLYVSAAELERDPDELSECQGQRYPLSPVSRRRHVFPPGYKYGKLLEHSLTPVISKVQV